MNVKGPCEQPGEAADKMDENKAKHWERKVESDHQEKIDEILRWMRIKVKHWEREVESDHQEKIDCNQYH